MRHSFHVKPYAVRGKRRAGRERRHSTSGDAGNDRNASCRSRSFRGKRKEPAMKTEHPDNDDGARRDADQRIPTRDGGRRSSAGSTYGDYTPPPGRERHDEVDPMGDYYTGGAAGAGSGAGEARPDAADAAPVVPAEGDDRPLRSQEAGLADGSRRR